MSFGTRVITTLAMSALLLGTEQAQAAWLNCEAVERYSLGLDSGLMAGAVHAHHVEQGEVLWTCNGSRGRYHARVTNQGIGVDFAFLASLVLYCPSIEEGPALLGTYWGGEVRASIFLGVDAAVFSGRPGTCYMIGFNGAAYGLSASGIRLSLRAVEP